MTEKRYEPQYSFLVTNVIHIKILPSSDSTPNSISTSTQLDLHLKSIQLLQELSWSYALYLVFTTTHQYSFLAQ